jgi:hypothetical protein
MAVRVRGTPSHTRTHTQPPLLLLLVWAAGFLLRTGNHGSDDSKINTETATSAVQFQSLPQEYSQLIQNHLS